MFSISATKLASRASENALKFGNIASKKVTEMSLSLGDKVSSKS